MNYDWAGLCLSDALLRTARLRVLLLLAIIAGLVLAAQINPAIAANVTTWHNDNARTGQNTQETILTPANVNTQTFGKLFSVPVDGSIYAQPLVVTNVSIPNKGMHNVVYVATQHDSIYAFDADTRRSGVPLWHVSFINPAAGITSVPNADYQAPYGIVPEVGVTGTPVIDTTTNTLYVVAATKEVSVSTTTYLHRLHALDISTGAEKFGGPVVVSPTASGTGGGNVSGTIAFDGRFQSQRGGLVLVGSTLYVPYGSHTDPAPTHGWIVAYDARTLAQIYVLNVSPNANMSSIWQAGAAPAADTNGNLFCATGNGPYDGGPDWGDSILKINTLGGLSVADSFTPYNQDMLNVNDTDLGSGGVMLLPTQSGAHPDELVQCGKDAVLRVIDRDNMGGFHSGSDNEVQGFPNQSVGAWSTSAYWNGRLYIQVAGDFVKAYSVNAGLLSTTPADQSATKDTYPGSTVSISANGSAGGIAWTVETFGYTPNIPSVLHAFDAANLSNEIYNSSMLVSRDNPGSPVRFIVPSVANGKVYVGATTQLSVYGLFPRRTVFLNNAQTNQTAAWYVNGAHLSGGGYLATTPSAGWRVAGSADFNGDGGPDLILQNSGTGQAAIWTLNGTTVTGGQYLSQAIPTGWSILGVGDFNGDGKPDLALQNSVSRRIAVWYLNGASVIGGAYLSATPVGGWSVVGAGDFNNDGQSDLLLQNTSNDQIAIWYLNGAIVAGGQYISITPAGWRFAGTGDFFGSGSPDLVLQNSSSGQIALWNLSGATVARSAYLDKTPAANWNVVGAR